MSGAARSEAAIVNHIVPAPRMRWLLLHYHIFKNAGSTIEYVLNRAFEEKFVMLHGPEPDSILSAADLQAFLEAHPDITAISTHHLQFPKPEIPGVIVFDLCFLRDPLQRLWSVYKYMRRVDAVDELGQVAKAADMRGFVKLLIREHPQLINDMQVNMLANHGVYTRPPSATDLKRALDILRQISVLGVVDLFDESLVAAEYFLRPAFPRLQFQYVRQNVSPTDGDTGVRAELREELGEALHDQLRKINRLDDQLLSYAKEEVLRRYDMVPDRETRLADFRERCEYLRAVHEGVIVPG